MAVEQQRLNERANQLYEQYAMPLEAEHTGKYVAISPSGQVVLGDTMLEVAQKANEAFGSGNFVFKLGQRAVGRWR